MLDALIGVNRALTRGKPRPGLSRALLKEIHQAFGGELHALLVGGAFTEPATDRIFSRPRHSHLQRLRLHRGVHGDHAQ